MLGCRKFFLFWLGALSLLISCASHAPEPKRDPDAERNFQLQQQGDSEFAKMHWRGWKNAAACYEEVLAKSDDTGLRQKLFAACVLLSLRETELFYREGSWLRKAEELLPSLPTAPYTAYLALAQKKFYAHPLNPGGFAHKTLEPEKYPVPRDSGSEWSHYLYVSYLGLTTSGEAVEKFMAEQNEFRRQHADSNLALYLRSWAPGEMDEKIAAFSDFAEMVMLRGDWHRSGENYREALADYQRALEIMPVLYKARNAMATLCYSLEEYEQALHYYGQTLEIYALEPTALFGRAICLSELRRYDESDQALHEMIAKQTFYHGEANYYLAKNSYYRNRPEEARSYLKLAAAFIPDSPEMNMLSGLLYLDRNQPGPAAADFRKVLEQQPQMAEAWFYLGQAALQEKKNGEARAHFLKAIENFRLELENFDAKLAEMKNNKGSDPYRQNYYAKRLRQRSDYARDAIARLSSLQGILRKIPSGLHELLIKLSTAPGP